MPTYVIGGKKIQTEAQLSDSQIEEIANSLGVTKEQTSVAAPSSGFLMGIKDPISAGAQLLPRGLEQVTSLGGLAPNPVSRFFGSEAQRVDEMVRAEEAAYQQQRAAQGETGFDIGRLGGNIVNPANIAVGVRAAQAGRAAGLTKVGAGASAGAATGALQPVVGEEFAGEKASQIGLGAVSGAVGEKVAAGVGRVAKPLVSKAEQTMRDLGIVPTPGQVLGGRFKSAEEFAQNLPLVGSQIENARQKTIFNFNKGVINKALNKVGTSLPDDVVGRDAVAFATDEVSKKYDDVLAKMSFKLDFKTTSDILGSLSKSNLPSPGQRETVQEVVNNIMLSKFPANSKITGDNIKVIESDLRKEALNYLNSASASDRQIGEALQGVLGVFKKEIGYQNPKLTPELRRVDSAFGDLAIMKIAAANSGAENGVFSPKQYQVAVRQADLSRKKARFAEGRARGQIDADAALKILGEDAKSTLEGRLAAQVGGGITVLSNPAIGVPTALGISGLYSPLGLQVSDLLLRSRPEIVKQFGDLVQKQSAEIGGIGAPQTLFGYNRADRLPE
jgi:hypothetical protein